MREGGLLQSLCLRASVLHDVVTGGLEMGFENQQEEQGKVGLLFWCSWVNPTWLSLSHLLTTSVVRSRRSVNVGAPHPLLEALASSPVYLQILTCIGLHVNGS